jgi:hypothetical protein
MAPGWQPPAVWFQHSKFSGVAPFGFNLALPSIVSFFPTFVAEIPGSVALKQTRLGKTRGRGLATWSFFTEVGSTTVWGACLSLSIIQQTRYADLNRELCTSVGRETFLMTRGSDPLFCAGYSMPSN